MNELPREELLNIAKPILFNTPMVRAILRGRKSATRRVIKPQPYYERTPDRLYSGKVGNTDCEVWSWPSLTVPKPRYKPNDILYVRETWAVTGTDVDIFWFENSGQLWDGMYVYKEELGDISDIGGRWHPSIYMPKEAARIFLKVTDVRTERLRDINEKEAIAEGVGDPYEYKDAKWYDERPELLDSCKIAAFAGLWDSTTKKKDLDLYGWDANPWVWIIEFERVYEEE